MRRTGLFASTLALGLATGLHHAAGQTPQAPARHAFSAAGLARLDSVMQAHVSGGKLPGIVVAVSRHGELVHWKAFGARSVEANDPMDRNDLFRIYSMTKPITSTAVMMLVEEGRIGLDDPVARYLPVMAHAKVGTGPEVAAQARPMTVRDLLRHTSGLTYGLFGETPVDSAYRKANLFTRSTSLDDLVIRLSELPLVAQPGALWNYGFSTDVLGRIVEIVSGKPLDRFFQERILGPLGMDDTFFEVPKEKRSRFTGYYAKPGPNRFVLFDSPDTGTYTRPPRLLLGGLGLVSSASDYLRFARMIMNGGELDGVRLLRPETAAQMTREQLPAGLTPISLGGRTLAGTGFGLGFSVAVEAADPSTGPAGTFGWSGYANTFFWIDPKNELVGLIMTQFFPYQPWPIDAEFRRLVYAAMTP
jgi:CubicO group peptidase (beta-lactamase class C family)